MHIPSIQLNKTSKCSTCVMDLLYTMSTFTCLAVKVNYCHFTFKKLKTIHWNCLWLRLETVTFAKHHNTSCLVEFRSKLLDCLKLTFEMMLHSSNRKMLLKITLSPDLLNILNNVKDKIKSKFEVSKSCLRNNADTNI